MTAIVICLLATAVRADERVAEPRATNYEGRDAAAWAADLRSGDTKARQRAAYALFKLGPAAEPHAVDLVNAIRDVEPYVRTTSAKAVARLGTEALRPVASTLASLLLDQREDVRREAAALVWRHRAIAADAVPELTKALTSIDDDVRARAAWCLGSGGPAAAPAVTALTRLLADPVVDVRAGAAESIAKLDPAAAFASEVTAVRIAALVIYGDRPTNKEWKDPVVLAGVLSSIDHADASVREHAVHALDTFAAFAGDERSPEWIGVFRTVLEGKGTPGMRAAAAAGLGRYVASAKTVVPPLVEAAANADPEVRTAAITSLGWLGDGAKAALPVVLRGVRDADPGVRVASASALPALGVASDEVIDALVAGLSDPDLWVVRTSLRGLGACGRGSERIRSALVGYLTSGAANMYACADAVAAIRAAGLDGAAVAALGAAIERDADVPASVAFALCALDAPQAQKALTRLVSDLSNPPRCEGALTLLRLLGPKAAAATGALIPLLRGDGDSTRVGAITALEAIGDGARAALPELERLVGVSDETTAAAARRAITQIRGELSSTK